MQNTTTQKAPTIIKSISEMDHVFTPASTTGLIGMHGYCTINYSTGPLSPFVSTLYDVYCYIDDDEVRIGRLLNHSNAVALVNSANAASHKGEEV